MALKVLGGAVRGHLLKMPGGGKTRPAMSRVKSSLFSILMHRLEGARVLDLFAGSGSIGIEALSRGASHAVFVDKSVNCRQTIIFNLNKTHFTDNAEVFREDCEKFLKRHEFSPFDLVFIDPPYQKGLLSPILSLIPNCSFFTESTIFIIERQKKDDLGFSHHPQLETIDERVFGDTVITIFRLRQAPGPETI